MSSSNDDPMASAISKIKPLLSKMTFGSVIGYCSGTAAKTVGKAMAIGIGFIYIAVQSAAYSGYIDVNWDKVQKEAISKIDTDGDGKITEEDVQAYWAKLKKMLTYNLPSASGFSIGFLYGLRA
eukprot:CAMPEP_0116032582 /NCGR_PEP_ID=MMETSP0321-20121206/18256_1 /TAXON_ID=163516 /ORGANISM="Leptocylindrus danicus var. danicus, Strain B650" /LENGTH=123 /DNA_ID=CAMNT_0003508047 /DNA_START=43 /DNA_END=414 /DNA_ORIENTATION=+